MSGEQCEHRKELMKFLLIKTAPVRSGVKPAEFLRVRKCYRSKPEQSFCIHQAEILATLRLPCRFLRKDAESSLLLFYQPELLQETLRDPVIRKELTRLGYPEEFSAAAALKFLQKRFAEENLPHEIGFFLGYPPKDVIGYLRKEKRTPVPHGIWQVFGDPAESLRRMKLYSSVESLAEKILETYQDIGVCLEKITSEINMKEVSYV